MRRISLRAAVRRVWSALRPTQVRGRLDRKEPTPNLLAQGFVLAETLLQALEADPPKKGKKVGTFEEEGFPAYSWEMVVEEEEIKYKNLKTASKIEDLKSLRHVNLKIMYDDHKNRKLVPVQVDLILPPVERFQYQSKFLNELFREEEK